MGARMVEIGYFLSSEEHGPAALVDQARAAADAGIRSVWISDHFHPWLDEQGESPFVWSVIGAIAAATPLRVTTAVTCPTMRIHPALVAHAAATCALLLDGRFELGVGSGENLNEHIYGDAWPPSDVRRSMLEEAVALMRMLWTGEEITHRGDHYRVENARLYSVPDTPPPVVVSAFGPKAVDMAARIADGFVSTHPDGDLLSQYREKGGRGLASGAVKVCWGADRDACVRLAHRLWRSSGVPGELSQDLRTPALFEQASKLVTPESVGKEVPCGPDVEPIVAAVQQYIDAGFDRVFLNQIGPDQSGFFRFFETELAPALAGIGASPEDGAATGGRRTVGATH
jgi:G6PDH family F420-dependent oxidoreductase